MLFCFSLLQCVAKHVIVIFIFCIIHFYQQFVEILLKSEEKGSESSGLEFVLIGRSDVWRGSGRRPIFRGMRVLCDGKVYWNLVYQF